MSATTKIWVNGAAPTCEDDDLNGFKNEYNNLIIGSGQSLSTSDNQQTHKAVAHYAGVGDFYVDSGAVNAYILSATGSQVAPPTYATGMRIRFVAGNTNTGASTINVAGLGVKALVKDLYGAALDRDNIVVGRETIAYYDGVSFRVIEKASSGTFSPVMSGGSASGTGWVYSSQVGFWVRSEGLFTLNFELGVTTIGSGAAGSLRIAGYDTGGSVQGSLNAVSAVQVPDFIHSAAGYTEYQLVGGSFHMFIFEQGDSGARNMTIADVAAPFTVRGSLSFIID